MSLYSWLTGLPAPTPGSDGGVLSSEQLPTSPAPGPASVAAPPLPEELRRELPAYEAYRVGQRTKRDVLIHIVVS